MKSVTYLQMNLIPMIAIIMMRLNTERTLSYTWRNRALRFIMLLISVLLGANSVACIAQGKHAFGARSFLGICGLAVFFIMEFAAFLWFLYVYDVVKNGDGQYGKRVIVPAIPLMGALVLFFLNPFLHGVFYVDGQNCIRKGYLFGLYAAVAAGYLIVASGLAFARYFKETVQEKKRECGCLAAAIFLPAGALILQFFCPGMDVFWAFVVVGLLMVYLNIQKDQVTQDGLTGLNNRRRLDQYLKTLQERGMEGENCHFILMDVDRFKKVNDTYGHVVGDMVLKLVADQLKKTFGGLSAFLARYGGDEFVVIIKGKENDEVEAKILEFKEGVAGLDWHEECPWKLAVSVGCVQYGENGICEVEELIKIADTRMYEQKKGIKKA